MDPREILSSAREAARDLAARSERLARADADPV